MPKDTLYMHPEYYTTIENEVFLLQEMPKYVNHHTSYPLFGSCTLSMRDESWKDEKEPFAARHQTSHDHP